MKNNMKLTLNNPDNHQRNFIVSERVKNLLSDLYTNMIDSISVSYKRSSKHGMVNMTIVWKKYMDTNSSTRQDYQKFVCEVYDNNKESVLLFDFNLFQNPDNAPNHELIRHVLPVGEMLTKINLVNTNSQYYLVPILDEWLCITDKPDERSVQFRIANKYIMYISVVPTFMYSGGSDIGLGLPVYDPTGHHIVGVVGNRLESTGNYSLLRSNGLCQTINLNSGEDILISYCNLSNTKINIFKDYGVNVMSTMDMNDIRKEECVPFVPKSFPTRISINQLDGFVIINLNHLDMVSEKTTQLMSLKYRDGNIKYFMNTSLYDNESKRVDKIVYTRVEISNKKKDKKK